MLPYIHASPPAFDVAAWISRKYRVNATHAQLIAELSGLGCRRFEFNPPVTHESHQLSVAGLRGHQ